MMKSFFLTLGACIGLSAAHADTFVEPILSAAKFTTDGKLQVRVKEIGPAGCYIAVNGGLSTRDITTRIIATRVTASDLEKETLTITTKRKYFCKRRKLLVQIEKICLGDLIGSGYSSAKSVSVPAANVKG